MSLTVEPNKITAQANGGNNNDNESDTIDTSKMPKITSELGLAVANNWVSIAYPDSWIIRGDYSLHSYNSH